MQVVKISFIHTVPVWRGGYAFSSEFYCCPIIMDTCHFMINFGRQ